MLEIQYYICVTSRCDIVESDECNTIMEQQCETVPKIQCDSTEKAACTTIQVIILITFCMRCFSRSLYELSLKLFSLYIHQEPVCTISSDQECRQEPERECKLYSDVQCRDAQETK